MNSVTDMAWDKVNVAADALVHTGPCVLHSIVLNGITTVGDVVVYDGIDNTGTVVATFNLRTAVHVSFQPFTALYDCEMATGIYFDYDATAAGNFTVMYR